MNIGLDVDGVLTDFEWFLDYYAQKMFGTKFKSDVKQYKFADRFYCSSKDEVKVNPCNVWRITADNKKLDKQNIANVEFTRQLIRQVNLSYFQHKS